MSKRVRMALGDVARERLATIMLEVRLLLLCRSSANAANPLACHAPGVLNLPCWLGKSSGDGS